MIVTPTDRALRVLHVAPYFPPHRIGGVGEVVAHVHRELLRRGHRSEVLTTGASDEDPRIHRIATTPAAMAPLSARGLRLARAADIVHIHHGEGIGLLAAIRARGVRVPVLLTLHASAAKMRRAMRAFRIEGRRVPADSSLMRRAVIMRIRHVLDRAAARLADRVTYISRSTARDYLPPDRARSATVVYNGLPDSTPSVGPLPEPVELLYVGLYGARKRVHILPLVLAHVRRSMPGCRLRIIGFDAKEHPDFMAFARSAGVADALVFEGALRSEDVLRYFRVSRVLLVPSSYEGLPMVVLEALQQELPCIATRVSGLPEVIQHGRNGLLVEPDNPVEMARAALTILEDPGERRRMGAAGRATVARRFTVGRQVSEYLALYTQMVDERSTSR